MGYAKSNQVYYYGASNDLLLSADTERTETSLLPAYVLKKEFQVKEMIVSSEFRIKWDIHNDAGAGKYVNSQIWKNGVYTGEQYATDSAVYVTASKDVSNWRAGDLIQLYCAVTFPGETCTIRNFRLYGIKVIGIVNTD